MLLKLWKKLFGLDKPEVKVTQIAEYKIEPPQVVEPVKAVDLDVTTPEEKKPAAKTRKPRASKPAEAKKPRAKKAKTSE